MPNPFIHSAVNARWESLTTGRKIGAGVGEPFKPWQMCPGVSNSRTAGALPSLNDWFISDCQRRLLSAKWTSKCNSRRGFVCGHSVPKSSWLKVRAFVSYCPFVENAFSRGLFLWQLDLSFFPCSSGTRAYLQRLRPPCAASRSLSINRSSYSRILLYMFIATRWMYSATAALFPCFSFHFKVLIANILRAKYFIYAVFKLPI